MRASNKQFKERWPFFDGHMEAKQWFEEKYLDRFIKKGFGMIQGERIYFYHLVMDSKHYTEGTKELVEKGIADGIELPLSYHIVGILEDGRVHIIY